MDAEAPAVENATAHTETRDWIPLVAFLFVVLSLVALAAIPALLLHRMSLATEAITNTILPAYGQMRDLAFAMEHRVSAARSRFLTADPRYDLQFAEARLAEENALRQLEEVAPDFDLGYSEHFSALHRYVDRRDSIEAWVVGTGGDAEAYRQALPAFDLVRDSMLLQLREMRSQLVQTTRARAREEARLASLQRVLSGLLAAVALFAATVVGWFALYQRRLRREVQSALEEAHHQRALAVERGSELARAAEARVRLLRGITHDVKNPLGAARGYAEILEMGIKAPLHAEQVPIVQGITRSVDAALAIIADLLDLARADSGGLDVSRVEVQLAALAERAVEDHRSSAETAGHTLEMCWPADRLVVHTDPLRVAQILGNLLSNAIKYTPAPGRITVSVGRDRRADVDAAGAWATIRVSDTGPGIPSHQREAIFDEFTRLEERGPQQGHGLGLAIARKVARLLGGDLAVGDSELGGATFVLRLPVRQADENRADGDTR